LDTGVQMPARAADQIVRLQAVHAANLTGQTVPGFRAEIGWPRSLGRSEEESAQPAPRFASRQLTDEGRTRTDFSPGALRLTGRDLDVAIDGKGWILVQKEGQVAVTRNGQLDQDADGQLQVAGWQVMGGGGALTLPAHSRLSVASDGTVSVIPLGSATEEMVQVDRIRLVNPAEEQLRRAPGGVFVSDEVNEGMAEAPEVRLRAGTLEESNVDAAAELIAFISLGRAFEMNVKMMSTYKETSISGDRLLRPDAQSG